MSDVRQLPPASQSSSYASTVKDPQVTAADRKTALALKPAINELMKRVRVAPTPENQAPKWDSATEMWRAPNGHALFSVVLQEPPPNTADMFAFSAMVDPRTDTFYSVTSGGIMGRTTFAGPLGLPSPLSFHKKKYNDAQVKLLEAAAAGKTTKTEPKPKDFHYAPEVLSASFSPGAGVVRPGEFLGPSVTAELLFPNITFKPEWKVKINEQTKTMTVTVDAKSGNVFSRVLARPIEVNIQVERPKQISAKYTLKLVDYKNKELFKTSFTNYPVR